MTDELAQLSLEEEEAIIENAQRKFFIEAGQALVRIRDHKKYRGTYNTFEDYCKERWGWSRRHANRVIEAADVVIKMGPIGPISELPKTEGQARELVGLEPEAAVQVRLIAEGRPSEKNLSLHRDIIHAMDNLMDGIK